MRRGAVPIDRMRILFLCGSLQSGKDGVGDYTRSLAESCVPLGNECRIIALNDPYVSEPVESAELVSGKKLISLRLPSSLSWPQRIKIAATFRTQFQPDWLSLQFVCYGFNPKGIVWNLVPYFQTLLTGCPTHIMFHELWIGMAPEAGLKSRLVGALQRLSIRRLFHWIKPCLVTTSNPLYVEALRRLGIASSSLPLFGNIPIVDASLAPGFPRQLGAAGINPGNRGEWWLGLFFGGLYPEWKPEPFLGTLMSAARKAGKRISLLSVGRTGSAGQQVWAQLQRDYPDISFVMLGEQSPEMVSLLMQACDFGIAASAWELIGKSGSAAAMVEHGLPVIVTRDDGQSRFAVPDPPSTDPLFHRWDETLESRLAAGLPRKSPSSRTMEIATRFCSMLGKNG